MSNNLPNQPKKYTWIAKVKESIEWVLIDHEKHLPLSVVYILQCEESFKIKIGITQNLDQRMKDIQSMCPTKLRLIACFVVHGVEVERFLHRTFDDFRLHGEWFKIPSNKCDIIEKLNSEYQELSKQSQAEREKIFKDLPKNNPQAVFDDVFGESILDFVLRLGNEELKNEN
jgi:Meiotically up-regulated gene 113